MRAVESAAEPVPRSDRPVEQRLVGLEPTHGAEIGDAPSELEVEMLDAALALGQRYQQLPVDLVDIELAEAVRGRVEVARIVRARLVSSKRVGVEREAVLERRDAERIRQ